MSEEVYFDKGSKRRIRRIRWKRSEILSAIALAVTAIGLSIAATVWVMTHPFD
ncbi:MAG TPA: hypothetical protein VFE27_06895 [Acidobacteriaceae bacterium]|jgi:hypothetical protein|nr:hypothetical protein [Acidobacteriaceae bacterium]